MTQYDQFYTIFYLIREKTQLFEKNIGRIIWDFYHGRYAGCHRVNVKNDEIIPEKFLKKMHAQLMKKIAKNPKKLRHGDLIINDGEANYRNDGYYVYDKINDVIVDLETDPDDYGTLPRRFKILEPSPDGFIIPKTYWHFNQLSRFRSFCRPKLFQPTYDSLCHNEYAWFNHTIYAQELCENIRYDVFPFLSEKRKNDSDDESEDDEFSDEESEGKKVEQKKLWTTCRSIYDKSDIYLIFSLPDEPSDRKFGEIFPGKMEAVIEFAKTAIKKPEMIFEILSEDHSDVLEIHPNLLFVPEYGWLNKEYLRYKDVVYVDDE